MDCYAIFAFGYDLGDGGLTKLKEYDSSFSDLPDVAWYDPDGNCDAFIMQAESRLLTAAGVTHSMWGDLEELMKEHVGVWFKPYGYGESKYLLLAHILETDLDDDPRPVDLAELTKRVVQDGLDTKLANALEVLGVTPEQERPAWLHCAWSA
ncbi:hypothetical protein ABZ470_39760 [Streptosporangium sp. NPDC020072]|uniref:hypothetical protein n=1 Tax=Streptosporangium sp. NPDC020072 TaxID=3154788 RepID=UPI003436354A